MNFLSFSVFFSIVFFIFPLLIFHFFCHLSIFPFFIFSVFFFFSFLFFFPSPLSRGLPGRLPRKHRCSYNNLIFKARFCVREEKKKKEERRTRRPKQVLFHNRTHRNFLLFACVDTRHSDDFRSGFVNRIVEVAVPKIAQQFCARCAEHFVAVPVPLILKRECWDGESCSSWVSFQEDLRTDRASLRSTRHPAVCCTFACNVTCARSASRGP